MPWPAIAFPLTVAAGKVGTVESNSIAHLEQQAEVVVRTPRGTLDAQPDTGLRDLIGSMGPVGPEILDAIQDSVPDAPFLAEEDTSRLVERIRDVAVSLGSEG